MNGDQQTSTHLLQIIASILPFITPSLIQVLDTLNRYIVYRLKKLIEFPDYEPPEPEPGYLDMREEIERWMEEEDLWETLITGERK